jgi:hypothetical protein
MTSNKNLKMMKPVCAFGCGTPQRIEEKSETTTKELDYTGELMFCVGKI